MRYLILIAAVSGFLAVLMGAMGSHFLAPYMSEKGPELFKTANLYHLVHSLALLGCALLWVQHPGSKNIIAISVGCFLLGILLFSGLIYYIALYPDFSLHLLIPLGGLFFMAGWIFMGISAFTLKKK